MATAVQNPLIDALNRLPILEPAQMEELPQLQEKFPHPRALAKELLQREWLTAYQANQIFLGHADDLVLGHYLCLNKIGEGGMGHVFKARQRPLDRIVALKVLRRDCMDNKKTVQRFQREIRAIGQLQHPHIVRAHDADESAGLQFIAMEYIEGVDLARMVKRQGPLAIEPALDFIRQAALGLQHAHEAGLVHRDIKPANLLVATESGSSRSRLSAKFRWGMVKVLDLGLARIADPQETALTVMGTVMGTPDFIAPEQALDPHACDVRADLYSLGCTFYYLIAGRIPFPRGGVTEKLMAHQAEEPEPLADVRRGRLMQESAKTGKRIEDSFCNVPADVDAIVRKLMAKRPEDRFQSAAALAHAIERVLARLTGDPMAITQTASLTSPSLTLTPLPAPATLPMAAVMFALTQRPPSWQSMVKGKNAAAIVDVRVPKGKSASATRWWLVGALCTFLVASTVFINLGVSARARVQAVETKAEKRR
jgi:serine/threonine protein kinase